MAFFGRRRAGEVFHCPLHFWNLISTKIANIFDIVHYSLSLIKWTACITHVFNLANAGSIVASFQVVGDVTDVVEGEPALLRDGRVVAEVAEVLIVKVRLLRFQAVYIMLASRRLTIHGAKIMFNANLGTGLGVSIRTYVSFVSCRDML